MADSKVSTLRLQPIVRYRLLEQFGDDKVKIRDIWHNQDLILSVRELALNEELMAQFSGNEACTIGYIFATQLDQGAETLEAAC